MSSSAHPIMHHWIFEKRESKRNYPNIEKSGKKTITNPTSPSNKNDEELQFLFDEKHFNY